MTTTIQAKERKDLRKSHTKYLRSNGFIPAVVYGKEIEPKTVAVNSIELVKKVRDEGKNTVFNLQVDSGESYDVLLYDYQMDDIKDEILHADFYQVDMSSEVDVEVPIQLEGEAKGEADGGIKQQVLLTLNIRTKPNNIPDAITVDVTDLAIGDTVTVGDLKSSTDYTILDDDESTIVTIVAPQMPDAEDEEGAEGEASESEATEGSEE